MFKSHRADYAGSAEVQRKLDELFGKIQNAYETLGDPMKRREYDRQHGIAAAPFPRISGNNEGHNGDYAGHRSDYSSHSSRSHQPNTESVIERGQASEAPARRELKLPPRKPILIPEIKMREAPPNDGRAAADRRTDGTWLPPVPPRSAGPVTRPPAVLSPEEAAKLQTPSNKYERALRFYRQGRTRFERHELEAAVHLFREAVTLDGSQAHYHFFLAISLTIQARAKREHMHHEGCHVTCKLGGALISNPRARYEAEQHFLRAFQIDPSNTKIALKLGQLYKEVGMLKKAEMYLNQALILDSMNDEARHELDTLHEEPEEIIFDDLDVELR
jgi:tetratricopeptide (TPR) repeat protein